MRVPSESIPTVCAEKPSRFLSVQCNGHFVPFPFMICSFFICNPFLFCSKSVCIFRSFRIHFIFVSCSWAALHMAVYGVYEVHMQGSSSCAVRRKIASLTAQLWIGLMLTSHASLNHTLCLHAFLLLFLQICIHQVMALALKRTYIRMYLLIARACGEVLVRIYASEMI